MIVNSIHDLAEKAQVSLMQAMDFMSTPVTTIGRDQSIKSTMETLVNKRISGAPVVDDSSKIIGIISEYDLLLQGATKDLLSPIEYSSPAITISPTTTLKEILVILHKKKVKRLPVVDKSGNVLGIISRRNILSTLIKKSKS